MASLLFVRVSAQDRGVFWNICKQLTAFADALECSFVLGVMSSLGNSEEAPWLKKTKHKQTFVYLYLNTFFITSGWCHASEGKVEDPEEGMQPFRGRLARAVCTAGSYTGEDNLLRVENYNTLEKWLCENRKATWHSWWLAENRPSGPWSNSSTVKTCSSSVTSSLHMCYLLLLVIEHLLHSCFCW